MTGFRWTDATGSTVELYDPRAIQAEAAELTMRVDRLFREADLLTGEAKAQKRREIRKAMERLDHLRADAERWDSYVEMETRERAKALANHIRAINENANTLRLVVGLHDEFELVSAKDRVRLTGKPSFTQQRAAALVTAIEAKDLGPNFASAFEHLQRDPLFYRPESDEGGWFEWVDSEGMLCRLASPLAIEREIIAIIGKLFTMIPKLEAILPHFETVEILGSGDLLFRRLEILQVDLGRFHQESKMRDDKEWECAKKEWQDAR